MLIKKKFLDIYQDIQYIVAKKVKINIPSLNY